MSRERDRSGAGATAGVRADPYEVRHYAPRDRGDVLALYEAVFGDVDPEAWFEWKYESNPFVDEVPMTVASADGTVVATKPCTAFRLLARDAALLALQPSDVMVHPDHRRQGLYSRTTELLKEYYASREPALFFNYPNEATLSGSKKHGWREVETVPTYYRVHDPAAVLSSLDGHLERLARVSTPVVRSSMRAVDFFAPAAAPVTVERHASVPVDELHRLYRREIPDGLHAVRDRDYLAWRYRNPAWSYETYVAGGDPKAAIVVGRQRRGGTPVVSLTDVLPIAGNDRRRRALAALLSRIVSDHGDAALFTVSGRAIPTDLLARFGFVPDDAAVVSSLANRTTLVTYPCSDDEPRSWSVRGLALTDPSSWDLQFSEQDTR